jgi:hypothetical protein
MCKALRTNPRSKERERVRERESQRGGLEEKKERRRNSPLNMAYNYFAIEMPTCQIRVKSRRL